MLEITKNDYILLDEFPLKWRWTDSRWKKLPADALNAIQPLNENKALMLCQYSLQFQNQIGLEKSLFESIEKTNANAEIANLEKWLFAHSSEPNQTVIVSWDNHLAVSVKWKVFCEYWNDFCYPASDDATIFPLSEEWMLFYSHDEYFMFGKK